MINMVLSFIPRNEKQLKTIITDKCNDIHTQRGGDKMATF